MEKIKIILFGILMFFIGNYYSLGDLKNTIFYIGEKIFPSRPGIGVLIIFIVLFFVIIKINPRNKIKFKQKF
jgi:hypothetical protein